MTEKVHIDPEFGPILLRRNPRARRLTLRVAPQGGLPGLASGPAATAPTAGGQPRIVLTLPWLMSYAAALRFLEGRREWVREVLARQRAAGQRRTQRLAETDPLLPVLGYDAYIAQLRARARALLPARLAELATRFAPQLAGLPGAASAATPAAPAGLPGAASAASPAAPAGLPGTASAASPAAPAGLPGAASAATPAAPAGLPGTASAASPAAPAGLPGAASAAMPAAPAGLPGTASAATRLPYGRVTIKHNRSNWGSCSARGNINLNLNVVRLPEPLRDYVLLHELCHLRYLDHSPRFHALLESVCPGHLALQRTLRTWPLL